MDSLNEPSGLKYHKYKTRAAKERFINLLFYFINFINLFIEHASEDLLTIPNKSS